MMKTLGTTQQRSLLGAFALLGVVAAPSSAQTVAHYWDFTTAAEVVSSIPTTATGTPDMSVHGTYGEAYPGAGNSMNIVFGAHQAGGGFLVADVHDGVNATAMDFGTDDFSFSYWSYNDTSDGNNKGPRIFDCLDGTSTGVQCGTNATNIYNLRVDTSDGGATISNNTLGSLQQSPDTWVHIAGVVDRTAGSLEIFFDGVSQGVVTLSAPSAGDVVATRDMDIGYINSDGSQNQGEAAGLDDLAFYDGKLGGADIIGLAAGTLTPLDFAPVTTPGNAYCFGDGTGATCPCSAFGGTGEGCLNTAGTGATLVASGNATMSNDTFQLDVAGVPGAKPGLVLRGDNQVANPAGDGILCTAGGSMRSQVQLTAAGVTTYTNFNGNGFGAVSNLGAPTNFQFWYRDNANTCSGAGFNFTNAWTVDYQL